MSAVVLAPGLTWLVVVLVVAGPSLIRKARERRRRVRVATEVRPRRRAAAELHAEEPVSYAREVVDHETFGWFGGSHQAPTVQGASREATPLGQYPLPTTITRRTAA